MMILTAIAATVALVHWKHLLFHGTLSYANALTVSITCTNIAKYTETSLFFANFDQRVNVVSPKVS